MKSLFSFTALLLATCMFLTACGGTSGTSRTVSESAVSGSAVSEGAVTENIVPTNAHIKTPYECEADFTIKEYNSQEYRAEISLVSEEDDDTGMLPIYHWELYLDMADEIKEISGAAILSHEGTHYIIQGNYPTHSDDDGWDEDWDEYKISFEITVSYREQIHEPNFCFFSKELDYVSNKNFDYQFVDLKKNGKTVTGKIRLTNHSKEKFPGWELEINTNFKIKSIDDPYVNYEREYDMYDDEEKLWCQNICPKDGNLDFEAGETKIISFTGTCAADKPKIEDGDDLKLYRQRKASDYYTWEPLEYKYGGSYTKMDEYLVADTVYGMDVFFVFDEKKEDSYTVTAELTNVLAYGSAGSDDDFEEESEEHYEGTSIADWEIYLECEDNIESITGAKIISHEGNVYHIGADDPDKWVSAFSFTTFQVKVSCPDGIHPLGKTYLVRAKVRTNKEGITQKEFTVNKSAFQKAASTRWLAYYDLYDPWFDTDWFEDEYAGEWEGFMERQKWGKKMGRMTS